MDYKVDEAKVLIVDHPGHERHTVIFWNKGKLWNRELLIHTKLEVSSIAIHDEELANGETHSGCSTKTWLERRSNVGRR